MVDWRIILSSLTLILGPIWGQTSGEVPPEARLLSLRLLPTSVVMPTEAASQRFLVLAEDSNGLE